MLFVFLIVIISIIAVLLTLVILLQSGRGGGLAGIASGGATTQILGSRQAPDFLEKATWVLGTSFIVLCILTTFAIGPEDQSDSVIQQQTQSGATQQPIAPPVIPAPADAAGNNDGSNNGSNDANQ